MVQASFGGSVVLKKEQLESSNSSRVEFLFHLFFFSIAFLLIFRSTSIIPGLSPDSALYVSLADSIRNGHGYVDWHRTPVVIYPPLYSTVLAIFSLLFSDIQFSTRIVNGILFGINVILSAILVRSLTSSTFLRVVAAIVMLCSAEMIGIHSMVWSEAIFVSCTLLFLVSITKYISSRGNRYFWLALVAAACGSLARYPGISLIAAGGIIIVLVQKGPKKSFADAALFVFLSSVPIGIWLVRNLVAAGQSYVGTGPSFGAFNFQNARLALVLIREWTGNPPWIYALILSCCFVAFHIFYAEESKKQTKINAHALLAIFIWCLAYLAIVLFSVYKYGLNKPFDQRFLAPIYTSILGAGLFVVFEIARRLVAYSKDRSSGMHWLVIGAGFLILFSKDLFSQNPETFRRFWIAVFSAAAFITFGILINKNRFNTLRNLARGVLVISFSLLILITARTAAISSDPNIDRGYRPEDAVSIEEILQGKEIQGAIYTNADDMIYLLTGRKCVRLPVLYDYFGKQTRVSQYEARLKEFRSKLRPKDTVLYLENSNKTYLLSKEDLENSGFHVSDKNSEVTLYKLQQ